MSSVSALLSPEGDAPEGLVCHQQRLTPILEQGSVVPAPPVPALQRD